MRKGVGKRSLKQEEIYVCVLPFFLPLTQEAIIRLREAKRTGKLQQSWSCSILFTDRNTFILSTTWTAYPFQRIFINDFMCYKAEKIVVDRSCLSTLQCSYHQEAASIPPSCACRHTFQIAYCLGWQCLPKLVINENNRELTPVQLWDWRRTSRACLSHLILILLQLGNSYPMVAISLPARAPKAKTWWGLKRIPQLKLVHNLIPVGKSPLWNLQGKLKRH